MYEFDLSKLSATERDDLFASLTCHFGPPIRDGEVATHLSYDKETKVISIASSDIYTTRVELWKERFFSYMCGYMSGVEKTNKQHSHNMALGWEDDHDYGDE